MNALGRRDVLRTIARGCFPGAPGTASAAEIATALTGEGDCQLTRACFVAFWALVLLVLAVPASLRAQVEWKNPLKEALKSAKPVIGVTVTVGHPEVAAALATAGFDFFWFEMEHSPLTLQSLRDMILATRGLDIVPITRVPYNEPWMPKRVLDLGSLGVIFPFTNTRELAEQAVKSCKYPPEGVRGFGPGLALSRWNLDGPSYIRYANQNVLVVVIIEQKEAVDRIDEIASVPGVDVLFIGTSDLSFSLGVGGQVNQPIVQEAIRKVLETGKKHNIAVGLPLGSAEEINRRIKEGFRFFQASSDLGLMRAGARAFLGQIEGRETKPPKPGTLY
jgi:2-keto-3-deoxy-L-rhamnonate aldolase RhmA